VFEVEVDFVVLLLVGLRYVLGVGVKVVVDFVIEVFGGY